MFSLLSQDIQNIIVFDLEWNQSGYNPNHRMPHEIIEIGACRVDCGGERGFALQRADSPARV